MTPHHHGATAEISQTDRKLILVGNPNVGKSLLFSALTGHYVTVSNYPGTTVEITTASATLAGEKRQVVDTPGTNSLVPQSEDERVTRDILLATPDADVVQVGDLKNLRRTLLITLQLAELGSPFTLCLNMSDEAREHGIVVDTDRLSRALGVDVVPTSALRRWNVERLKNAAVAPRASHARVSYSAAIEEAVVRIEPLLPGMAVTRRAIALSILSGDETLRPFLRGRVDARTLGELDRIIEETQARVSEPLSYVISRERLAAVDRLVEEVYSAETVRAGGIRQWIGTMSMHPLWGVPFLAAVLFIAWWFVGKFGAGDVVNFVENTIFNGFINPWLIGLFDFVLRFPHHHDLANGALTAAYALSGTLTPLQHVAKFFHDLFVGPFGIITMALTYAIAIVLPVVTTFFIFFGILEDSGYLPRLAVMLNRIFKMMGLNGKAVLPMVLGLGCDTMATLTTRILETKKEAIIVTLLLALGVPCSAQLGVIMAMLGPLPLGAVLTWLGVIAGTIFIVGWLSSKIIRGDSGDFLLEIPPVRVPKMSNILIKVAARTEWYLKEAVPLFIVGTLALFIFDLTGLLKILQKALAPLVVGALHLPAEASNAFLIGFLRRDYGAAGLFMMQRHGLLDPVQTVVALTIITLFVPCVANFLVILKERGTKVGLVMTAFIVVYAFGTGWILDLVLRAMHVTFTRA
jgi:ferrous iron transport protein B